MIYRAFLTILFTSFFVFFETSSFARIKKIPLKMERVKIKPRIVNFEKDLYMPKKFLTKDHKIDLSLMIPSELASLSDQKLGQLIDTLSKVQVRFRFYDENGKRQSAKERRHHLLFWRMSDHIHAAAAVAVMNAILEADKKVFTRMLSVRPYLIAPYLATRSGVILDDDTVAAAISYIIDTVCSKDELDMILVEASSALVFAYLRYWSYKDSDMLKRNLSDLIQKTGRLVIQNPDYEGQEKKIGLFIGILVSGALRYCLSIKSKDERRIWMFNSATNIVWAATTFLSAFPLVSSVSSAIAGSISLPLVIADAVYNKNGPRDFSSGVKMIESEIELASLMAAEKKSQTERFNTLFMLAWMKAVIHAHGFSD